MENQLMLDKWTVLELPNFHAVPCEIDAVGLGGRAFRSSPREGKSTITVRTMLLSSRPRPHSTGATWHNNCLNLMLSNMYAFSALKI